MITVRVKASNRKVRQLIGRAVQIAQGHGYAGGLERVLLIRMGVAILGKIKTAFEEKARGGTDECGLRWQPLSPRTIAYSRRHPKVYLKGGAPSQAKKPGYLPPGSKRAAHAPSWMLTAKQNDRWWELYSGYLGTFRGNKHAAAAMAWRQSKAEGATTIMATYGQLPVEILRDTGLLFNSLSPGASAGAATSPPRKANQIFRLGRGEVVIGTSRKWAWTHHQGTGHIPQRRLWAEPSHWPQGWWRAMLTVAREGLIDILIYLFQRIP